MAEFDKLRDALIAEGWTPPTTKKIREIKVPDGQTPLDVNLHHRYLEVIKEGEKARNTGVSNPYHGHSLEHCLHATGWVNRDLRIALDGALTILTQEKDK